MNGLEDPRAVIRHRAVQHELRPGEQLTVGRGSDQQLRLGHEPVDGQVSRAALVLECRTDGVLVTNASSKHEARWEPESAPGGPLRPHELRGSMPHPLVRVVLTGDRGLYEVNIDSSRLRRPSRAVQGAHDQTAVGEDITQGGHRLSWISDGDRQLLMALCMPVSRGWEGSEGKGAPSYTVMSRILGQRGRDVSPQRIRNALDELRLRLARQELVWNVHSSRSDRAVQVDSYLPQLAEWALRTGNVTTWELDAFEFLTRNPGA